MHFYHWLNHRTSLNNANPALLIMRFLGFPLLIQYGGQLQVAVRRSPPVTLLCFYGFNLALNFMVESKGVYSSSKSNENRLASEGARL